MFLENSIIFFIVVFNLFIDVYILVNSFFWCLSGLRNISREGLIIYFGL